MYTYKLKPHFCSFFLVLLTVVTEMQCKRFRKACSAIRGRSPFALKIRLEWKARNSTGFSRSGVSPGPSLSRLEENNKSKWRLHLQCRKAGKGAEVNRVKWAFANGTGILRSFRLEREKGNTTEDFHLFQKLSGGMSCTI